MSDQRTLASRLRGRRTRAVLASGVALGLGATVTLAAWSDSEFATSALNSAPFNVQGTAFRASNPAESDWGDHTTAGGAMTLISDTNGSAIQPGQTLYYPATFRVDPTKNGFDGSVVLTSGTPSGNSALQAKITWQARLVPDATWCTSANATRTETTAWIPAGQSMAYTGPSSSFTLPKNSTKKTVCFMMTMADMGTNDDPANWNFGTATLTQQWRFDISSV